ncbi:MAG TPA: hypothetical protein EYP14_18825, partial [Planctomycetaceae bacterium]|nr:hypothetical protein [Planctomycetaceae bacterium]
MVSKKASAEDDEGGPSALADGRSDQIRESEMGGDTINRLAERAQHQAQAGVVGRPLSARLVEPDQEATVTSPQTVHPQELGGD